MIPPRRSRTLPMSMLSQLTQSCWRGLATGVAGLSTRPVGWKKRAPITRLPLTIPLRTMASSRAPSWGSEMWCYVGDRIPIRLTGPRY
jgi:hypothetical protein